MLLKKSFAAFLACLTVLGPVEAATAVYQYRVPLYVTAQAPALAFVSGNVDLSAVAGKSTSVDVVLRNTGNVPLPISGLALQNTPSNVSLADGCTGTTLKVGATCTSLVNYSATTAGNWSGTLTAVSTGLSASVGISATGLADSGTARVYTVTASPASILASTDSSQLSAAVVDAYGNQLGSGIVVSWGTSLGALGSSTSTTGADGRATNSFTSNLAGVGTLTGKVGSGSTASTSVTVSGNPASARVANFTASPASIAANGAASATLQATLTDANGNSLGSGIPVQWATSKGTLASNSTTTNASGVASVQLTAATVAGLANLTAKTVTDSTGKTATVDMVPDTATAGVASISASPTSLAANGSTTSTVSATLKDANGNLVAGVPVTWATTLGALAASSSITNASGVASIQLTSAKTAGSATLTAKSAADAVGKTISVDMVPDTATAAVSTIAASPTSLSANGSATTTVTATLKDANGNIVTGAPVSWTTTLGTLSAASSVTNASGAASVTLKAGTTLGNAVVTAKGASPDAGKTATVSLVADTATAQVIAISASPSSLTAGNSTTVTASVQDAYGHALSGVPVYFNTTLGSVGSSVVNTNGSGVASTTTSSSSAGTATVRAYTAQQGGGGGRTTSVSYASACQTFGDSASYAETQTAPGDNYNWNGGWFIVNYNAVGYSDSMTLVTGGYRYTALYIFSTFGDTDFIVHNWVFTRCPA